MVLVVRFDGGCGGEDCCGNTLGGVVSVVAWTERDCGGVDGPLGILVEEG